MWSFQGPPKMDHLIRYDVQHKLLLSWTFRGLAAVFVFSRSPGFSHNPQSRCSRSHLNTFSFPSALVRSWALYGCPVSCFNDRGLVSGWLLVSLSRSLCLSEFNPPACLPNWEKCCFPPSPMAPGLHGLRCHQSAQHNHSMHLWLTTKTAAHMCELWW